MMSAHTNPKCERGRRETSPSYTLRVGVFGSIVSCRSPDAPAPRRRVWWVSVVRRRPESFAAFAPHGDRLFELFAPNFVEVFRRRNMAAADFPKVPAAGFAK